MISILTEWESRCGDVVSDLEAEIARVKTDAAKRAHKKYTYDQRLEKAVERRQNGASGEGGGGRRGNRARFGAGLGGSKRDADDIDQDDGFFETGDGEGSRMDIDEGAGVGARSGNSRSKRVLGRKS
jgi:COP9 signalosome complex subunit 7